MSSTAFPPGFLFGVATSAAQIEGAVDEGGRGESVWDRFASIPGNIADGTDPRVACDHWRRWRDDFALLAGLGVNAYRFSIAWPRVLPSGRGTPLAAGLATYDAMVDALLEAGITPHVTLDHWDLPQALQDQGGWYARSTVDAFVDYADAVSRRLGDRVQHWATHNEPWCVSHLGHETGVHAPGLRSPEASLRVAHHLLLSHGRALPVVRRNAPGAQVGIVNILTAVQPASESAADRDAAREYDGFFNRWFLDPIFHGRYPADAVADRVRHGHLRGPELDFALAGDMAAIAAPIDFLGINYYSRNVIRPGANGRPESVPMVPRHELTDMGWEVWPAGLREVLLRVTREYAPARIHVTENGAAFPDPPGSAVPIDDARRVAFLRDHLEAAAQAIADGVPLEAYFAWSFMDNFEWGQGFAKRFGLFHVDYVTQRRTPRASAHWYRDFIARHAAGRNASMSDSRRHS